MWGRAVEGWERLLSLAGWVGLTLALGLLLGGDAAPVPSDTAARVQAYTRPVEFDFVDWTIQALWVKLRQEAAGQHAFVDEATRADIAREYFALRRELESLEREIARQYADPAVTDPAAATAEASARAEVVRAHLTAVQPIAEAILQEQLSVVLAQAGLTVGGQPTPPVAFHFTPLPYALIVSPRTRIEQAANLDVDGELSLAERVALEVEVSAGLDVSTLVVPLGGIGTYPTMVGQSSDANWSLGTVAHEWIHNYLTLRPLGFNYLASAEMRTMNETTAEIAGQALSTIWLARYYPELAPPRPPFTNWLRRELPPPTETELPPASFDFRAEMRQTRQTVDRLLAEGKVLAAEAYMEARRRYLWDQGYQIRKLNQAYFAFYGAYAVSYGGTAGADPAVTAVELMWRRSPDVAAFLNTMAAFTSLAQLQQALGLPVTSQ